MDKRRLILPIILLLLGASGCLLLYTQAAISGFDSYYYFRQTIWLIISLLSFFFLRNIRFSNWKMLAPWLSILASLFLLSVLLFGTKINGMTGWFRLEQFSIQPNEICKPIFIIMNAWILSLPQTKFSNKILFTVSFVLSVLWIGLIVAEPDFGTAIIYFITFFGIHFICGTSCRCLATTLLFCIIAGIIMLSTHPYAAKRISAFFSSTQENSQTTNWHTNQMEEYIVAGGWRGYHARPDSPKIALPYQANDSLFAFAALHLGFLGILPLIILPMLWLTFCLYTAGKTTDVFKQATFAGSGIMIFGQTILHLAVNTGLLPVTGVTMPLISYGGSSLLAIFCIIAICDSNHA